tara:strand:- start:1768 stop:2754 length:987 start_codon:yes stop_codon:yes gene_type:complete
MIRTRNSNDYLHTDIILSRISEYDIFKYYCQNFKEINLKFCSDLRDDKTPTVSIIMWNSKLLYKDFGSDHAFNCFSYVSFKYNCTFYDALRIIDNDFNLKLSSKRNEIKFTKGYLGCKYNTTIENKKLVIIKTKRRAWSKADKKFWSQYLITKDILIKFAVEPIDYYWINNNRFKCKLSYAFNINNKYKIYSPYEDVKWMSNTNNKSIQGWDQLPKKGKHVILTSSLKDVICLHMMGFSAIALQSEMQMPNEKLIKTLRNRFNQIFILYDNDFDNLNNPGQTMANKICIKYDLKNIYIPSDFKVKDISDYIAKFNSNGGAKTLIQCQI